MMLFLSRLFVFLTLVLLSFSHNMVTAQCSRYDLTTTRVSSTTLSISWGCYDPSLTDQLQVIYGLTNREQCDTGDGSQDPPFDYQYTQWGTWNRQVYTRFHNLHSATLTNLLPYSTYSVYVRGRYPSAYYGYFLRSDPLYIDQNPTTSEAGPTAGPAGTVTESTANSLEFYWTEVPCGFRGGVIIRYNYKLIKHDDNTIVTDQDTADATQMSVNIPDLELGQMYEFQIAAINDAGTGPSTTIFASTIAGPDPPESVTILEDASTNTSLTFSWNAVSCVNMDTCNSIGGYSYTLFNLMDELITNGKTRASETSVVIPNLQPCTSYVFSVAARSELGIIGSYSDYVEGTALAAPPDNVMVTDVNEKSLTFTWMKPMCGEEGTGVIMYSYVLTNNYRDTRIMANTYDTSIKFTDLTPYVTYNFRVAAWSSAGQGPYSDAIEFQTLEDKPSQPLNLVSSNVNSTSITMQWSSPDPPHGVIVGYEVRYWEGSGSPMNAETTRHDYTVSGLQINDTVSFQVRAETGAGKGVWSKTVTAKAVEGVPGIPVNLTALDIEETSVMLQWKAPIYSNGIMLDYPIKYKAILKMYDSTFVPSDEAYVSSSAMLNTGGSIHGYTVDNLSPSTKYEFLVAGRTSAGSGEYARIEVFTKAFTGLKQPNPPAVNIVKGVGIIAFNDLPEFVSNVYIAVEKGSRGQVLPIPILHIYIVANLTRKEVDENMTFTVGDSKTYRGYVNYALIVGQSYSINVAYASCTPEECLVEWSYSSIFTAPSGHDGGIFNQLGPVIGMIGGGVVALIVIGAVLIALICYYRRNKASTKETQRSQTVETGYEVNMAMEANTSTHHAHEGSA